MITFKGELKDYLKTIDGNLVLTIITKGREIPEEELTSLKTAKNGIKIDVCRWTSKRSLDSNAYLWVLLDKIAEKIGSSKICVYKNLVRDFGVFEILPIKNIAVERFAKNWQNKGVGWICESLGDSKIRDYTNVIAYYGTSTYNSFEMSRILNEVVLMAKDLGIQTLDELELKKMADEWEKKYGDNS